MNEDTKIDILKRALRSDPFTAADRAFVPFLEETYEETNPFILTAAALCLAATREGHSYFDLSSPDNLPPALTAVVSNWPSLEEWQDIAATSPCVGSDSEALPLVLANRSALYLRKYYEYEQNLAQSLVTKASKPPERTAPDEIESDDPQQIAVSRALLNQLYIISGGPGTGKTTTVLGYLTRAIGSHEGDKPLRIAAVAPTGKAAARLSESIRTGIERLDPSEDLQKQLLEIPCMTLHRLLQGLPNQVSFRRNRKTPLEYDILVVDETSMIDLPLMQKLLDATPDTSSIVFLGDHNQLASVEVGSVFSDMTRSAGDPSSPLFGKLTTLTQTYRFSEDSSIHQFCELCKNGQVDSLDPLLANERDDFAFHSIKSTSPKALKPVIDEIMRAHASRAALPDLEAAFKAIGDFTVLTPFNQGIFGAQSINRIADAKIRRIQNLNPDDFYRGMPLIILENNYDLELFNGDIGIVWPREGSQELFAWFNDLGKGLKPVRLNWLPKYALAYCLTIHKSQGSEFNHVTGVFSPEDNKFVSRELIYTCASRAKERLTLFSDPQSLRASIQRSVKRATRLEEQILECAPTSHP